MDDFQIISKLGEGAYSIVSKVKRLTDGNIYAMKKVKLVNLSEKEKQNALNEVRILASVKSKNVISYKECFYDENENCLGIIMEYADKGDLYQKVCELKKLQMYFEETDIWRIIIQIINGLKSLHDMKILHRDLKSANVFLFSDGTAKLGDLNVSKVARKGLGYTQTGTPYYASPEVWKDKPYDLKSDMWSLGCVIYEMVTLRPPFRAENMEGLYQKVIKGQYTKISEKFSTDLSEIIRLLLQIHPEKRPNCDQILKSPIILKRIEYFRALNMDVTDDFLEDANLLQTIRIPKNMLNLTDKLPRSNYGDTIDIMKYNKLSKSQNELPELNQFKIQKDKNKEAFHAQSENKYQEQRIVHDVSLVLNSEKKEIKNRKQIQEKNEIRVKKPKNVVHVNNSIDNDLMLLPNIRNQIVGGISPLNIQSKRGKEASLEKLKEESRNIAYNEKKILQMLRIASLENKISPIKGYIPYVINNRGSIQQNKYMKNKGEKSYSPVNKPQYHPINYAKNRINNIHVKLPNIQSRKLEVNGK